MAFAFFTVVLVSESQAQRKLFRNSVNFSYDDARRLTSVTAPNGDRIDYSHNLLGNVTKTEHFASGGALPTYELDQEFDELGRILRTAGADGQIWNFRHDEEDNLDFIRDPLNNITSNGFDALNRLVETVDEHGETITQDHDDNDAVTSYTDPRGLQTSFVYNGFGEVMTEVSPDKGTTSYTYDRRGLVTSMTDGRNVTTNYTYDDDGRLTSMSYPSSSGEDQTYTYDQTGGLNTGQLTTVTDQSGQTTRSYNNQGLIASETRLIDTVSYQTDYAYDDEGLLDTLTYPSGLEVRYARNIAGEITAVDYRLPGGSWAPVAGNLDWLPFGGLAAMTHDNGVTHGSTYDKSYRLQRITETLGLTPIRDIDYGYSARDNLVSASDLLDATQTAAYSYDARQMISGAVGPWGDKAWGYDPVGNRMAPPGLIAGTTSGEVITGTGEADIIRANGGFLDDLTGGGGADLFDFANLDGNGQTDYAIIRDFETADGLNFGATPIAFMNSDGTAVTIVLDGVERDMIRVEPALGSAFFNDMRRRALPLGIETAPNDVYTYGAQSNQLAQIAEASGTARAFTYDTAGNTLQELRTLSTVTDDWSYSYNAQNRLSSVKLNGVEQASYLYNFAAQQVVRTVWNAGQATKTVTVHDLNGSRLGEYDDDTGALLREYIWLGAMPLTVLEGGQLFHLHVDHIDRPVMATDSAGTAVWQASYTPFGGIHQVSVNTGALSAQDLSALTRVRG